MEKSQVDQKTSKYNLILQQKCKIFDFSCIHEYIYFDEYSSNQCQNNLISKSKLHNIYIYKFLIYILDDNDDDADQIEMGSDDGGGDDDGGEEEDDDVSTKGRGTSRDTASRDTATWDSSGKKKSFFIKDHHETY